VEVDHDVGGDLGIEPLQVAGVGSVLAGGGWSTVVAASASASTTGARRAARSASATVVLPVAILAVAIRNATISSGRNRTC
jgi:hypothetical protein